MTQKKPGQEKKDLGSASPEERRRAVDNGEPMPHPDEAREKVPPADDPGPADRREHDQHKEDHSHARARAVLDRHRPLSDLYGSEHLLADRERELLSVAELPRWMDMREEDKRHTTGHGLGRELNHLLGGIGPGYLLGVAAAAAKAGKTAFIHQLADGLAMRSADLVLHNKVGPLTPVVTLSEMSARDLTWRSLARWTGYPVSWFRAGRGANDLAKNDARVKDMWTRAEQVLSPGDSVTSVARSHFCRAFQPGGRQGAELLRELEEMVKAWRQQIEKDPRTLGREVWPVVMIDPIQRHADSGRSAVEALDYFSNRLNDIARANGWIVLLTSDATKASATGSNRQENQTPEEEGAGAFRGSYTLQHVPDAALYLRPVPMPPNTPERQDGVRELEAVLVFNRWGPSGGRAPRFDFHRPTMRLYPQPSEVRERL